MKRLLVLALVCLAVVSCKKDDDDSNSSNSNSTINGCLCPNNYQFTANNNPDTSMFSGHPSGNVVIFNNSSESWSSPDVIGNAYFDSNCDYQKGALGFFSSLIDIPIKIVSNNNDFMFDKNLIQNMQLGEYIIDYNCLLPIYPDYGHELLHNQSIYINWNQEYFFTNNSIVKMNLKQVEVTDVSSQLNTKYRYFIRMGITVEGLVDENDTTQVLDLNYDFQLDYVDGY